MEVALLSASLWNHCLPRHLFCRLFTYGIVCGQLRNSLSTDLKRFLSESTVLPHSIKLKLLKSETHVSMGFVCGASRREHCSKGVGMGPRPHRRPGPRPGTSETETQKTLLLGGDSLPLTRRSTTLQALLPQITKCLSF